MRNGNIRSTLSRIDCHHQILKSIHLSDDQDIHDDSGNDAEHEAKDGEGDHPPGNRGPTVEGGNPAGLASHPEFLAREELNGADNHLFALKRCFLDIN